MVVTGEKRLFVVLLCPMDVAAPPRARRHSGWQTREQQKSLAIEGSVDGRRDVARRGALEHVPVRVAARLEVRFEAQRPSCPRSLRI